MLSVINSLNKVNSKGRGFLLIWAILIFVAFLTSAFLHEVGHGFGSRLTGVHVSTGFNRVGNPGKFPDDPDFRTGMGSSVLGGALGPGLTLSFATVFTLWLRRRRNLDLLSLAIGAVAISNALLRLIPMLMVFGAALFGKIHIEDEIGLGVDLAIWTITRGDAPGTWEKIHVTWDRVTIVKDGLTQFGSSPLFWLPAALSMCVALLCLILAYKRLLLLFQGKIHPRRASRGFWLILVIIYPIVFIVANFLDRIWRINW